MVPWERWRFRRVSGPGIVREPVRLEQLTGLELPRPLVLGGFSQGGGVAAMLAWGGEPEDEDVPVLFEEPRGLRHEVPVDFDRRIAVALDWVVSQRR